MFYGKFSAMSVERDSELTVDRDGIPFWSDNIAIGIASHDVKTTNNTVDSIAIPTLMNQKTNIVSGKSSAKIEKVLKSVTTVADTQMPGNKDDDVKTTNDTVDSLAIPTLMDQKTNIVSGKSSAKIEKVLKSVTTVADTQMPGNKDVEADSTETISTDNKISTAVSNKPDLEETSNSDLSIIADVYEETGTDVNVKHFMCPVKCSSKSRWTIKSELVSHLKTEHKLTPPISRRLTNNQFETQPLDSLSISDVPNCFLCGVKQPNPARFKDHMTSVHCLKLLYQCPFCFGRMDTVDKLNRHIKNDHGKSPSSFIASDDLQPILVNKVMTSIVRPVSHDTREKYNAHRILTYLKDYNCSTNAIISCSCGKWLPTFQKLLTHLEVDKSCQPQCYGCGTKLTSNAESINDHFINKKLCKSVYSEAPASVMTARKPSYLTSRSYAYPSTLKCHICTDKFDNCTDECTVSHLVQKHAVVKTIAERIIDTALAAPVLDNSTNIELPQCFVCEASVSDVAEFKCHLENHKEVIMMYQCPFCFSLHKSQPDVFSHTSNCVKSIPDCRPPPAASIMPLLFFNKPLLFPKNKNALLEMVPLRNTKEVRALQIMRTLPINLPQTKHNNSDIDDSNTVIHNEQKGIPSATDNNQVHQANTEVRMGENLKPPVAIIKQLDVVGETETDVDDKYFMCPIECSSKTKWTEVDNLTSHLTTVHNLQRFITFTLTTVQFCTEPLDSIIISDVPNCFICGEKPSNPACFKDHIINVHGLRLMYQCPLCMKIYADAVCKLNIHIKEQHNKLSFVLSDHLQPILVKKIDTHILDIPLDTQEKCDALRILRYLKDYKCSTNAIISCSCGKWLPTFQKLIIHTEVDKSCQPQCYGCGTKLMSNVEAINDHFIDKSLCRSVYTEAPASTIKERKPSYLTSRSHAYPSTLICHICTDKFDNSTDVCTVSHFITKHCVSRTIAERIIDTALAAPVLDDSTNIELPQCFVCEASVSDVAEFKCHLECHEDVMMLYECPFCFSLHKTQPGILSHSSICNKLIQFSRLSAGSIIPFLFRKNIDSMFEMVPLRNANEVRALQILRTLSINLPLTRHDNGDTGIQNIEVVIRNDQKDISSPTNINQVHQASTEFGIKPNLQTSAANMQPSAIGIQPLMRMSPFPMVPQSSFPPEHKYVCFECHKTLNSAVSLKHHLFRSHNIILKWQCSRCLTWHACGSFLEMHLRSDHKIKESPAAILSKRSKPKFVRISGNQYIIIVPSALESRTFHQALRQVSEYKLDDKRRLKRHVKDNCKPEFLPDPAPSSHREQSFVMRSKHQGDVSEGLALCPFCKKMKSSHENLVSHLIEEHHVKKNPATAMSKIMYSGQIPKSDPIPRSYTCRECHKKITDLACIKDHSEKHGIRLRFMCPECSQLKPTTSELAVHLVQQHDADFSYAVSYTSGTEPILAKTKHGKESKFESEDTLLYFLRQTQYTNITLPDNTLMRPQREYSCSPISEDSFSSDGSFINDSPSTKKPLSTKPWWKNSEDRGISPSYSMISSTFSDDINLSDVGGADEPHFRRIDTFSPRDVRKTQKRERDVSPVYRSASRLSDPVSVHDRIGLRRLAKDTHDTYHDEPWVHRRRDSFSPRDERKTRKPERDVSPVYRSASRLSDPVSVHDRTGLHRLAKDTHDTYEGMNIRNCDRYSKGNNKEKLIKRGLLSGPADLEGMLSRTGSAVTGRVNTKQHDGRDRKRTTNYESDLRHQTKTTTHYERDFMSEVVNRDSYKVAPERQDIVKSSVDLPVTKLRSLHSLESGQSIILNGRLFLVLKHVDSCLLRKT